MPAVTYHPVQKITADRHHNGNSLDAIAIEEPLEISLQFTRAGAPVRQTIAVTMRTPGHDADLACGFLFTEGIVSDPGAIAAITVADANHAIVTLKEDCHPHLVNASRHSYMNSSCGVCGKTSIDSIFQQVQPTGDSLSLDAGLLYSLPAALTRKQDIFTATGGLHAAALFECDGEMIAVREDIGRHNALDKTIGFALSQRRLPLSNSILLLSGRACFELIQKAAMAGIKVVAAIGPPSSLAISLAEKPDITLVGFLREQRFNIYTGARRITFDS
ncbi:MAG TPA: formate dehydrogenase accessory sulfurtransferase FdhD [Puia sp.]|nr:formate dehydrogenase accessory sulfurtransferase FdhD [Puia sp.]